MVTAAVCYFVGHGVGSVLGLGGSEGSGAISSSLRWRHAAEEGQSQGWSLPLREVPQAQESVGSVAGAEEEGGQQGQRQPRGHARWGLKRGH